MMGAKVFGVGPARRTNYAIVLIEQESGEIAAIVDGSVVTAVRTSATSALAVDWLTPRKPLTLALLGSSLEAWSHLQAVSAIRDISEAWVYSPTKANRDAFCVRASETFSIRCQTADSVRLAVEGADIVIAAARSADESPILFGEWLAPNAVIVSVGSTVPEQREIDISVVEACDLIVCDAVEEVVSETGDMIAASVAGIDFEKKVISLNTLLSQSRTANQAARRPLYKSVGNGVQDIIIAELAFERARAAGLTRPFPLGFHQKR
jgi:ornithine cyclodeaminase/alanine dehydrogenase-like protein (mu-crystallin family)